MPRLVIIVLVPFIIVVIIITISIGVFLLSSIFNKEPIMPFIKNSIIQNMGYYKKNIVAYVPYWQESDLNHVDLTKINYLQVAFFGIKNNQISYGINNNNLQLKKQLKYLLQQKKLHHNLKINISIGSSELDYNEFSKMLSNEKSRSIFINSIIVFISKNNIDGINFDWEYPKSLDDKVNFSKFIKEIREQINVLAKIYSKEYFLSVAIIGKGAEKMYDLEEVSRYVNAIEIMGYDLVGKWSNQIGHHSNLYKSDTDTWSVDDSINMLLASGVPSYKILVGIPFYGIQFSSVDNLVVKKNSQVKYLSYDYIYNNILNDPLYENYYSKDANSNYLFSETYKTFISYHSHESIAVLVDYVYEKNLQGLMIWHLGQDSKESPLLQAVYNKLK